MNEVMPIELPKEEAPSDSSPVAPAPASLAGSTAIIVLGMHRSGTSAIAGMLHHLGVALGSRLMPASTENLRGYWEHVDIVTLHDAVLAALGRRWSDVRALPAGWETGAPAQEARRLLRRILTRDFAGLAVWGVKDPRMCRMLPLWLPLFQEMNVSPRIIFSLRHPDEVAASLQKRDAISGGRARLLWLRHVLEAERASRGLRRAIVHYEDLIRHETAWAATANRITHELEMNWPVSFSEAGNLITEFLSPELRHQRVDPAATVQPVAVEGWIDAVQRAFAGGGMRLEAACDQIYGELARADAVLGEVVGEFQKELIALLTPRPATAPQAKVAPPAPQVREPPTEPEYAQWLRARAYTAVSHADWVAERAAAWPKTPKLALGAIVQRGTEMRLLPTLRSLQTQMAGDWELHVIIEAEPTLTPPEPRVVWHRPEDEPIAVLNRALIDTDADWVALIDLGDQLAPHALFTVAEALFRHQEWMAVYSDEDRIGATGVRSGVHFKPDFNLDLLRSMPYIGSLLAVRRETFAALGGFDPRWDGLEEYDIAFRVAESGEYRSLGHVAEVLYHRNLQSGRSRRPVEEMFSDLPRVVKEHLDRMKIAGTVEPGTRPMFCRVRYRHEGPEPMVSVVIPTKNQLSLLKRCAEDVLGKTQYENYEIIIIDNGSNAPDAVAYLNQIEGKFHEIGGRIRVLRHPGPFNFSVMNNRAVREQARGEYICLLNNDAAPLEGGWLGEMMHHARRPEVGVVGAKLTYPDGRIQHGGVILGIGNGSPADHPYNGSPGNYPGYWGRLEVEQDFSAVTAACFVTRRSIYDEVGGLDEGAFAVAYNDVDYCLRVRQAGYLVVWTPYARLLHEASASLKSTEVEDKTMSAKQARFDKEIAAMYERWPRLIAFDPAYNRNLTVLRHGFAIEHDCAPTWNPEFRPRQRVIVHPADREGCGEYRMIAPCRALYRAGVLHSYETMRLYSTPELERISPDSIVFQRQLEISQINVIERIKNTSNTFRIFEIDDLITNLPLKSVHRKSISSDIGQRLQRALSLCQRLVVSTEPLASAYGKLCDQVVVRLNRLEKAAWLGHQAKRRADGKPRVGWAGAVGHTGDLALITGIVEETSKHVDWVFLGMCPEALKPHVAEFHEWVLIDHYPKTLASLDLDLAVAPLELNPFNEAKSNLRLLEYGVMGFPVICTDITPYQGDLPVTRLKNRHRDWTKTILDMVADREACWRQGDRLREAVLAEWMLEDHLEDCARAWLP
jgi:O-antigen biosynthesis protein